MEPTSRRTRIIFQLILCALVTVFSTSVALAETYYRGGRYMDVKPNEYKVKNGKVDSDPVTGRGVSLSTNKEKMQHYGGAYKVVSYPSTLRIFQRGRDPEHYEVIPAQPMTPDEYIAALQQVKLEKEDW